MAFTKPLLVGPTVQPDRSPLVSDASPPPTAVPPIPVAATTVAPASKPPFTTRFACAEDESSGLASEIAAMTNVERRGRLGVEVIKR
jgi:hypothetical protein